MRRLTIAASGALLAVALTAPGAFAASPTNAGCWGTVTSQLATYDHSVGEHSSAFAGSARLGLGNVARVVLGADASVGDLGAALASLDGLDATHCP